MCRWPVILIVLVTINVTIARAAESEGCLNCHQYSGLARVDADGKTIRDFYVDPAYYGNGLGPHARLRCTDCHPRAEVEVFPHNKISKVNCLSSCHLSAGGQQETRFSHRPVAQMLASSVHSADILSRSNTLLGSPLQNDQSRCLLCHDEPKFPKTETSFMDDEASVQRCSACHDQSLPQDTHFDFQHVHARNAPSRSHVEVVRTCGLCHSNTAVKAAFKFSDATATYLASFHGKAVLLGEEKSADCLNCHAGLGRDVHAMLKSSDPRAPTSPLKLPLTCRTSGCHGTGGAQISTASVHFEIPASHGIELVIACLFLVMIAFTFGPSLTVTALKLLHHAMGRHDPDHQHYARLADVIMSNPHGRKKLIRFDLHQRLQHWLLAVSFTTLCLTGFPMKFAAHPWAAWMIARFGGLAAARVVHRAAGTLLITGFVYHLVYVLNLVWQAKNRSGKSLRQTLASMPMNVGPQDGVHLMQLMLYLCFLRKTKPSFGKFNPEEKFEYFGVFWGTFMLGVTGLLMWANGWTTRHLPGRILTIAALLHTFEAFLALLHIGIVHLANVVFHPESFPVSKAMLTGETPRRKLAEAHGTMLKQVAADMGMTRSREAPHA